MGASESFIFVSPFLSLLTFLQTFLDLQEKFAKEANKPAV
jgi:hypothetical protein